MPQTSQNQLLDLLDRAHRASDDGEQLDQLLESANAYIFEDHANAVITKGLPHFADFDPYLERHVARLEAMIEKRSDENSAGLSLGHHAQIVISDKGQILTSNSLAKLLLSEQTKGYIEHLQISLDGLSAIREILTEVRAGVQNLERIIYLQTEEDSPRSAFGYCRTIPVGTEQTGLHISMSFFEWSPALYKKLQAALDLSNSEALVLQGVLNKQSYGEIAKERNRTVDTIKTQAKAVLRKAGCARMDQLAHLCTSIAYVVGLAEANTPIALVQPAWVSPRISMHELEMPDGRTLGYYEYGDPKGKPILFIHGFFQGPYFSDDMKRQFLQNNLRVIAPSRPLFGVASKPAKNLDYNQTTCTDTKALLAHLDISEKVVIAAHHGGSSHAFRITKMLGDQVKGMVMIGAGIPIHKEHLKFMSREKRMISAAARHAPSVLNLIITIGLKTYHKKGIQSFLLDHYAPNQIDMDCLENPEMNKLICDGMYHLFEQGRQAFLYDARIQMEDWSEDLTGVNTRQHWLAAKHCHLMGPDFVEKAVAKHSNHPVETLEQAGYNILYQQVDRIIETLCEAVNW
ncbi:MAG: alpha/beta hydrolase [Robiginitomaculum sp.]|nr:alpha/beta hydrolase [Robiginitomaculum sp.]